MLECLAHELNLCVVSIRESIIDEMGERWARLAYPELIAQTDPAAFVAVTDAYERDAADADADAELCARGQPSPPNSFCSEDATCANAFTVTGSGDGLPVYDMDHVCASRIISNSY